MRWGVNYEQIIRSSGNQANWDNRFTFSWTQRQELLVGLLGIINLQLLESGLESGFQAHTKSFDHNFVRYLIKILETPTIIYIQINSG